MAMIGEEGHEGASGDIGARNTADQLAFVLTAVGITLHDDDDDDEGHGWRDAAIVVGLLAASAVVVVVVVAVVLWQRRNARKDFEVV
jgi:hypothetical protein